ncbi:MAG: DinB family protein [Mucilaginibacter sp.]
MTKQIEIIRKTRTFLLEQLKELTADQLNKVPEGFNNNIIWNLGHMIAAQQGICYKRADLTAVISDDFWEKFRSGSKPEGLVSTAEIEDIKQLFFTSLDQLEADYGNHIFAGYAPWMTRYNVELASIDEAINFLQFHEGLHLGYVMALKRLVK